MSVDKFFDDSLPRIDRLANEFVGHVVNIDNYKIRSWIKQFDYDDFCLALKLLENIMYFSPARITKELGALFDQLKVIKRDPFHSTYYTSFGPVGTGADHLIPSFRLVTKSKDSIYDSRYLRISELSKLSTKRKISLVILDDFIGTGEEVLDNWDLISGTLNSGIDTYLVTVIGYDSAIQIIESETNLKVIPAIRLNDSQRLFNQNNTNFSATERTRLKEYCNRCGPEGLEEGYGKTQSLVVLHYRISDNVVPLLWYTSENWKGLFVRYLY